MDKIDKRYKLVFWINKKLISGDYENPEKIRIFLHDEARDLQKIIKLGCNKKIDVNGDCFYLSIHGKARYCSTCTRRLKVLDEILKRTIKKDEKTDLEILGDLINKSNDIVNKLKISKSDLKDLNDISCDATNVTGTLQKIINKLEEND